MGTAIKRRSSQHWASRCKFEFSRANVRDELPLELTDAQQNEEELQELERFFSVSRSDDMTPLAVAFATMAFGSISPAGSPRAAGAPAAAPATSPVEAASSEGAGQSHDSQQKPPAPSRWKWRALRWKSEPAGGARDRVDAAEPPPPAPAAAAPAAPLGGERPSGGFLGEDVLGELCEGGPPPRSGGAPGGLAGAGAGKFDTAAPGGDAARVWSQSTAQLRQRIHRPVSSWELVQAKAPEPISPGDFKPLVTRRPLRPDRPRESHYEFFAHKVPTQRPEHRRAMQWQTETIRKSYFSPVAPLDQASSSARPCNGHAKVCNNPRHNQRASCSAQAWAS